jgi:hypothetical protein
LSRARARTHARFARAWGGGLYKHQPPARPDFTHPTAYRWNCCRAVAGGDAALDHTALASAATLDPLAHVLNVGPPRAGLDCSWHRRDANSAGGG